MALAGSLELQMAADVARLRKDLAEAKALVTEAHDSMVSAVGAIKGAFASIGIGLSLGAFIAMTKNAAELADQTAKMGDRFGIATEELTAMQHAANLAGVSQEGLTTALRGIARSSVEAAQGSEQMKEAYGRLGINVKEFLKLPMDRQLSIVIDRLGAMESATIRNATAQTIMGRNAGQMMGLVAEGSKAFKEAREDTEAWGLALSRVDAAKIELANDAIKRAEDATRGFFTQVALAISAGVATLANYFADTAKEARGYRQEVQTGAEWVVTGVARMLDALQALRIAWTFVKLAIVEVFDALAQGLSHTSVLKGIADAIEPLGGTFTLAGKMIRLFANTSGNALENFATSTRDSLIQIKGDLLALEQVGTPGDKMLEAFKLTVAKFQEEAEKFSAARKSLTTIGELPTLQKDQDEALTKRVQKMMDASKTETDILRGALMDRQYDLDLALEKEYITQEQWEGQSAALFGRYQADLTAIQDEETKKRYGITNVYHELDAKSMSAFLGMLGEMMSSHSRAAFNIGKAAAISQAIIDTYRAAQGAYAALAGIPIVGPALGAAAAAAAIVVGIARVQQIKATQFGGGSVSAGGAVGTFSANPNTGAPTAPIGAPLVGTSSPTPVTINVTVENHGTIVGPDGAQQFMDEFVLPGLQDAIGNRDVIIIPNNSRQAATLTQ